MLLNKGELDGKHFLGRKTVELMTTNHLPPELIPYEVGGVHSPGYGYGLGVDVLMDVGQCQSVGSEGAYSWGGAATTSFWIDPKEELIGIQMAQFQPSGFHLITQDFKLHETFIEWVFAHYRWTWTGWEASGSHGSLSLLNRAETPDPERST